MTADMTLGAAGGSAATAGYGLPLLVLALLLVGSLIVIGRGQGLKCLVMLIAFPTLLFAVGGLLIRTRLPALPVLLIAGLLAMVGQVFLLLGTGASGRRAALGAAGAYLFAVIVAALCIQRYHITGVYSALLQDLWYAPGTGPLDFRFLALGTIALAGTGIIADLAVAVTVTIQQVHKANPGLSGVALFASGMRFGRDVIGTEINTLPFALLGGGLGGILLALAKPDVQQWPYHWMYWSNRQSTAVEISAMAAGTIGLALTIPLTAVLVAHRLGRRKESRESLIPEPQTGTVVRRVSMGLLLLAVALAAVAAFRFSGTTAFRFPPDAGGTQTSLVRGEVRSVQTPGVPSGGPLEQRRPAEALQILHVLTTAGKDVTVENAITGSPVNDRIVAPSDRVVVRLQEAGSEVYASLSEIERDRELLILLLGVCAVVVAVAGWSGWRALLALVASLGVMGFFLTIIVRTRASPLPLTLACAFAVAAVTYVVLCGPGRKAVGACFGVVLGLTVASGAALLFGRWMGLSGRHDGDLMALAFYSGERAFDFPALLGASALLGALGVTTDVSIAVASAVEEVHHANPRLGFRDLLSAGFAVGGKVIVAMFGAIFFAVAALNIGIFLLPWAETGSLRQTLGNERVATEVYRLLIGGLAIAWCVPAAALCSAGLAGRRRREAAGSVSSC
ncbi:MAG: YibE/F family protein [bacterium]